MRDFEVYVLGSFIGLYLAFFIGAGIQILVGMAMGLTLFHFSVYGIEFRRSGFKDKFQFTKSRFKILPLVMCTKKNLTEKEDLIYTGICGLLKLILFGGLFMLYVIPHKKDMDYYRGVQFLCGMFTGMLIYAISYIVLYILVIAKGSNNNLMKVNRRAFDQLWAGASFSELDINPAYAEDKSIGKLMRCSHLNLCCGRALEQGDYNGLTNIVRKLDEILYMVNDYDRFEAYTGCYYQILFYSTYINQNIQNAMKFYNIIGQRLESDMDPNGRRILAYYQYYILKQPDKAEVSLRQAEEAINNMQDSFFTKAEIDLEKKFIKELKFNMAYNPIMR